MPDSSQLPLLPLALTAAAAGVVSAAGLLAYSVFAPRCQFWAPVVRSLPQGNGVALTFDDGPHPASTPAVLDALAAHGVKATFFVIGRHAQKHPDLLRRIAADGHALGNHTLDHDHFGVNGNRAYWDRQLGETQNIVADITGRPPFVFRPPMGFKTWHVAAAARACGLPMIGWSVRAFDTRPSTPDALAARILRRTTGHDILLLHDGVDPARAAKNPSASQLHTAAALPALIRGIREKDLTIAPLIDALVLGADDRREATRRTREKAAT
jgi:peptidoglycan/xylan/chitin deacetylase (PgdA/CDA1 family)